MLKFGPRRITSEFNNWINSNTTNPVTREKSLLDGVTPQKPLEDDCFQRSAKYQQEIQQNADKQCEQINKDADELNLQYQTDKAKKDEEDEKDKKDQERSGDIADAAEEIYKILYPEQNDKKEESDIDEWESNVDTSKTDSLNQDSINMSPWDTDPLNTDPARMDPWYNNPSHMDPSLMDPSLMDPSHMDPWHTDSFNTDSFNTDPVDTGIFGQHDGILDLY